MENSVAQPAFAALQSMGPTGLISAIGNGASIHLPITIGGGAYAIY
jgi:hypothetical protein